MKHLKLFEDFTQEEEIQFEYEEDWKEIEEPEFNRERLIELLKEHGEILLAIRNRKTGKILDMWWSVTYDDVKEGRLDDDKTFYAGSANEWADERVFGYKDIVKVKVAKYFTKNK